MKRRRFLTTASVGLAGALGGCLGRTRPVAPTASRGDATAPAAGVAAENGERDDPIDPPGNATALARRGWPSNICDHPAKPEVPIDAIVEPSFARGWTDAEVHGPYDRGAGRQRRGLGAEAPVIGMHRDGSARAYPLSVVAVHEAINDRFGGPVLVTYCPRCRSGMTAERRVDGRPTTFHVSGNLWQVDGIDDNLVLYDAATGSYWSQLLATALCGPAAGAELSLIPTAFEPWGAWLDAHPETDVLLPPPASRTDREVGA